MPFSSYACFRIMPADDTDKRDLKWSTYLANHWQKRTADKSLVTEGKTDAPKQLQIIVDYKPEMTDDYRVKRNGSDLYITARHEQAMLWLQYQLIAAVSDNDSRFSSPDLAPASLSFDRDVSASFAFEYRGIYSPSNTDPDLMPIMATHNVDFDWGLWGHNLQKVFTDEIPSEAKALIDGERNDEQFCFSSEALYKAYEEFIIDNYGPGNDKETIRFAVLPNDNSLVCQCEACRKAGNTEHSATPAVTKLIERLAKRFPKHEFFTSAYQTTVEAPAHILPENVGVLISTLDLSMTANIKAEAQKKGFEKTMESWKNVVPKVYVWDYMRNFDDYLTPFPCLHALQSRLQYFHEKGVKGVFLNGSGYDYASFDDVQTYVISQLLVDPNISVDAAVEKYFRKFYPTTAALCNAFYKGMEEKAQSHALQPYWGIADMAEAYLQPQTLEDFWSKLDSAAKKITHEEERTRLNRLLTALCFTRMETLRLQTDAPSQAVTENLQDLLKGHQAFKDMKCYREVSGNIDEYIDLWYSDFPWLNHKGNILLNVPLQSSLKDADRLTNGKQGFPSDYHTEWLVSNCATADFQTTGVNAEGDLIIKVSALQAPKWHIYLPASIELWQGNKRIAASKGHEKAETGRHLITFEAKNLKPNIPLKIRVTKTGNPDKRSQFAIDEMEAFCQ